MHPREQKLILKGKLLTDNHVLGEYLMGAVDSTILVMTQPDAEKELDLKIAVPGTRGLFEIYFKAGTKVETIKAILETRYGIPAMNHMFQFYHQGEVMKNERTLLNYNVKNGAKLYMVPGTPIGLPSVPATTHFTSGEPAPAPGQEDAKPAAFLHTRENLYKFFPECKTEQSKNSGTRRQSQSNQYISDHTSLHRAKVGKA